MSGERVEQRKAGFKTRGLNTEELRRRREEVSIEIRKVKREDSLNKRRAGIVSSAQPAEFVAEPIEAHSDDEESELAQDTFLRELTAKLPTLVAEVYSDSLVSQLKGTTEIRKLLSKNKNPPIDHVISCNVIPRFIQFCIAPCGNFEPLSQEEAVKVYENLQYEAVWALTNITSGNAQQTWVVVQHDAIPVLARLIASASKEVQEQSIWALGNIAGDSPTCRDMVLDAGVMQSLIHLIHQVIDATPARLSLIRNIVWTVSNLCRGKKPAPNWSKVSIVLPTLSVLLNCNDREILVDTLWTLSYLSDGSDDQIEQIISTGCVPRIVSLLSHENYTVQIPALRCIGNIVTGIDALTQAAIDAGALQGLLLLLSSPRTNIVKEACWTISNITAGNVNQIQAVIDANLIPPLISILQNADFKTKKEACWAISNAASGKTQRPDQVRYLVSQGCIKPLCDLLSCHDNKVILVALNGLSDVLEVGERDRFNNPEMANEYALYVEEAGGMEQLYELQAHENVEIYKKSKGILEKYFSDEDADLDIAAISEGNAHVNPDTGTFDFAKSAGPAPSGGFKF